MLLLKYLLMITGWGLLGWAAAIALNNLNWSANAGFGSTGPGWYKETGLVDPGLLTSLNLSFPPAF